MSLSEESCIIVDHPAGQYLKSPLDRAPEASAVEKRSGHSWRKMHILCMNQNHRDVWKQTFTWFSWRVKECRVEILHKISTISPTAVTYPLIMLNVSVSHSAGARTFPVLNYISTYVSSDANGRWRKSSP
ncbi:putative tumor suppressor protein MN1 [Platysternon megacephalum]|uniref:Arylamine N-acetyltransferase, pineal gland isozyme NAT-3-like n=1 Tax=Platysternon megacephalum TaxID=55544 RepID=A0A4D9DD46_9SAUR|nr:arylamine N-acetyltransferase, pineal gland isozyme NAT-3-like [Platysternon megacephalum]TFK14240.1 putative tumor suppressor protein MN1 [Platysternon megacephalum]